MKLFMDSSTNYLYLALFEKCEIATFVRSSNNDHSETLTDLLANFLKENNVNIDDIDEIFVGRGPGSYTGVRISGTVAKVLALIKKQKLYSFSTLDLMLVSQDKGTYMPKIKAKKNYSYFCIKTIDADKVVTIQDDCFMNDDKLEKDVLSIEATEQVFQTENLTTKLLKYGLYQEEDVFGYVPNYLRSEING